MVPSAQRPDTSQRLSNHLRALDAGADTTVGAIVDSLGSQAFGATMFVFAAPNLIPNPPGTSPILGLPLIFLTVQLVLGRETVWLPEAIRRRKVSREFTATFIRRAEPALIRIEKFLRPRYPVLAGSYFATRMIGLAALPVALILLLPLPFLHMLPGGAMTCFALALAERDGLAAAVGYVLALASLAVIGAMAFAAKIGLDALFPALFSA